ncbi:hypothetical protein BABINDRAFT_171642 [Babjeviella inositovora NRRL Y-12698]|uniref:DHHA2 domain-containing protein n=1 Tax=Babjeviella inositovora NRRL Y-12698 TaxID=984486 RepID=A0A1E3QP10_9ASCO|nr:uncharacterized protein BABINDRAFT_171642 [Babjeviella inositovora NRRL Y-12698]ODQ79411.1 hypothetical protein BABINDRAFT_171642 [Babjeviella inositovora NRRL Y-12698]
MTAPILSYLQAANKTLAATLASKGRLRIVSGNQSADLDSVVSAITYAYFHHVAHPTIPIIPLINIPRADLNLRKDIVYALGKQAITVDLLYFVEDFHKIDPTLIDLVLVDHCAPQGDLRHFTNVISIIDHHDDENMFLDAQPRIIEKSGSCSCLVFNYWYDVLTKGSVSTAVFADVMDILVAPLLTDTGNMSNKVEPADIAAFDKYSAIAPFLNFAAYADELKQQKKDLSGLTLSEILRKDYKAYEFQTASDGIKTVGISSMPKSFSYFFKNFSTIEAEVKEWGVHQKLDLVCMMASDKKVEFVRQIAFYDFVDDVLSDKIAGLLRQELQLESLDTSKSNEVFKTLKFYKQLNVAASRKQVAPAMKEAVLRL